MPYIGHSPTQAGSYIEVDDFGSSFNGSNVAFTLQVGGVNITPNQQNLLVMIDGVLQQPSDAFSVSGSTITFTEAPVSGADLYCLLMGQSASIGNGTIGADELKISGNGTSGQLLKSDGDGTYSYLNQNSVTAGTATTLATARTINSVSFDGSANITVTADANTLSNTTLKSTVVNSSLTSVGTLTGLTVSDAVTFSKSTNGDYNTKIYNANAGTAVESNIYITNSSSNADGLFAGVGGTNFTTASGFVQDGAWIGSGSGASGGLSIMTRANADMRFYTNGHTNLAMTIDSSQRLGIGTASPETKVHIVGLVDNPLTSGTTSYGTLTVETNGSQLAMGSYESSPWSFYLQASTASDLSSYRNLLLNPLGGNVGIGEPNPSASLHVKNTGGTSYGNFITIEGDTSDNNNYSGISFKAGTLANAYPEIGVSNGGLMFQMSGGYHSSNYNNRTKIQLNGSDGHISFQTGGDPATEVGRFDSEGNFGIGASGSNLNARIVRGFSANKGLVIETQQPAIQLVDTDNTGRYFTLAYEQGAKTVYMHNQSNGPIRFDTNGTERMRLLGNGGLTFNGDTADANALDDYEEGTISTSVSGITATTKSVTGTYTKIGRTVFIQAVMTISGKSGGSGNPYIPLPFAPSDTGLGASKLGASIYKNTSISGLVYFGLYGGNAQLYANNSSAGYIGESSWSDGEVGFNLTYNT